MDPDSAQLTQNDPRVNGAQESFFVSIQRKRFLFLGGVGALMVAGIGIAVLGLAGQQPAQPEMAPVITEEIPGPDSPTVTPNPEQLRTEADRAVNAVLSATKTGTLERATQYFQYGVDSWQTEEGVLHTLRLDKARFTDSGVYDAKTVPDTIEISEQHAQVSVVHTVAEKQSMSRYDLVRTPAGWRITKITYDKAPDLVTITKLQEKYLSAVEQPTYYESLASLTLPAGDVVDINKTLVTSLRTRTGGHQDIDITVRTAKRNYTLALYDGANVVDSAVILANQPGTHFHSFDIRPLLDLHIGSLLFYPDNTVLDTTKPGKPEGFLYEIPIKLELKQ